MSQSYSTISDRKKKSVTEASRIVPRLLKKGPPSIRYITVTSLKSFHNRKLSQAMVEFPQHFEENKISIVQKFVSQIDEIPKKFRNIETLYLSNNNIRSLEGLEQFCRLKNVSLAHNEIDDASTLQILELVPSIEVLNLNGNPICRLPNYRDLVISLLPNLRMFDGKNVTSDERHRAEVNLRTQSGLLDVMLTNYCELIKINDFLKKIELHKELLTVDDRFVRNLIHIDVNKWRKMYMYEQYIDDRFKNQLKSNLLNDIHTLKTELQLRDDENEVAFSELILRQQQKIAELTYRAEEVAKQIAQRYKVETSRRETEPGSDTKRTLTASPSLSRKSRVTFSDSRPGINKPLKLGEIRTTRSPDSTSRTPLSTQKRPDFLEDKDLYQKLTHSTSYDRFEASLGSPQALLQSPKGFGTMSARSTHRANQGTANFGDFHGSPISSISPRGERKRETTPKPAKLGTKPSHKDECCRNLRKKSPEIEQSYPKRLEERERLIEQLTIDLRHKNQELIKMEELTRQMKDRLREYQFHNEQNVKVAHEEIGNMSTELERSAENQRILENEVKALKARLSELFVKTHDLEKENSKLKHAEMKANDYAQELEIITKEQQGHSIADQFRYRKLTEFGFYTLRRSVLLNKKGAYVEAYLTQQRTRNLLAKAYHEWMRWAVIQKLIQRKKYTKNLVHQSNFFYAWLSYLIQQKKLRDFLKDKHEHQLHVSFVKWKKFISMNETKRLLYKKVYSHFVRRTLKRAFKRFVEIRKRTKYNPAEERVVLKKADKYKGFATKKRIFYKWAVWAKKEGKPARIRKEKAYSFYRNELIKKAMTGWLSHVMVRNKAHQVSEIKRSRRRLNLVRKIFYFWANDFREMIRKQSALEFKKKKFIKKRLLNRWKSELTLKRKIKHGYIEAAQFYADLLKRRVINTLSRARKQKKHMLLYQNIIRTKHNTVQAHRYLSSWIALTKTVQLRKAESERRRLDYIAIFFRNWHKFYRSSILKKLRYKTLERYLARQQKEKSQTVFEKWCAYTRSKKRNQDVLELLHAKKVRNIYRRTLFELLKNSKNGLKKNINKLMAKSAILEASIKDNADHMHHLDAEKFEILEKTHNYQQRIEELKEDLIDKDHEIGNLKRVIHQYEKNERKLLEDLHSQTNMAQELETRVMMKQEQSQQIVDDYDREVDELRSERVQLLRRISELESELKLRHETILHTEQTLLNKSATAESIVRETEKKLAQSIKIANEFKGVIEKKDHDVQILQTELDKAQMERNEYQKKLAEAMMTIRETKEFYEGRVKFLESQNTEMHDEMSKVRDEMIRQDRQITDLKQELRKYEYQVDILTEQTHQQTEEFISNLKHSATSPTFKLDSAINNFSPKMQKFTRERSASRQAFAERKQSLDEKIHILEEMVSTNKSNKETLETSGRFMGFNTSPRSESTRYEESGLNSRTSSAYKPGQIKRKYLDSDTEGRLSTNSIKTKTPVSHKSPRSVKSIKVDPMLSDYEFERLQHQRRTAKEAIEKRIESLNNNIQADLNKVRNKFFS